MLRNDWSAILPWMSLVSDAKNSMIRHTVGVKEIRIKNSVFRKKADNLGTAKISNHKRAEGGTCDALS